MSATDAPLPDPSPAPAPAAAPAPASEGWRWAPWWVIAFVALWPMPGIAEGVMVLGAIAALVRLVTVRFRGGAALLGPHAWALTSVLFVAYWLPQAIAAVDAVDVPRALKEVVADLRYLPFLWLAAAAVSTAEGRRLTFLGIALIVCVWTLDALVEAVGGVSPLFHMIDAAKFAISGSRVCDAQEYATVDRLSGVLGPCNLKLGIVLASLSPIALFVAGRSAGRTGWVLTAVLIGAVIVLAGSRASWITYTLVLVLSGWRTLGWRRLAALFAFGATVMVMLAVFSPQVRDRLERTAAVAMVGDNGVDTALSGRARIWGAALCMAGEHPVNGVGPRGFRTAFPACDPSPGQRAQWGIGPALHAHQIVLEIASETGFVGLLLWLAGAALAWRAWRYADRTSRDLAYPAMVALLVTVFPLNTHLAFYSTFWGGVTLLLAALYAGSLLGRETGRFR